MGHEASGLTVPAGPRTAANDAAPAQPGLPGQSAGYAPAMKKLLIAMALGAALAWLFDPDNGARRRDSLRHKLEERGLTPPAPPLPEPGPVTDVTSPLVATGR